MMKKTVIASLFVVVVGLLAACVGGRSSDSTTDTTVSPTSDTVSVQQKVDLSWVAPNTRTDGSYLDPNDLVGYKIYYGTSPDQLALYEEIVGVSDTATSITISTPGIYYFAVTAYDADGLESSFSEIVSKEAS
jgi:hypothetical protein